MKLKRELGAIDAPDVQVDNPRPKRRKHGSSVASHSANGDIETGDGSHEAGENAATNRKTVSEQGKTILNAVINAKDKQSRLISYDFQKLPSKKQYPDYYALIKRPIALDEIGKRLERGEYASLEAVKADFDTCFKNAKKYNMKDSQIWLDAKALHKIANTEYRSISGVRNGIDVEGSEDDEEYEEEEETIGKPQSINLRDLMKTRMDKLVSKRDSTNRVISEIFMELPSKKMYPFYYKTIKKPMCFNQINRRVQRKEYASMADFAAEVELVFSNAVTFNEEHSVIWEDAMTLKAYFKQLMSDLPPPYALPEYSAQNGKLKLRVPAPSRLANISPATQPSGLKLKLPTLAAATATSSAQQSPKPPQAPIKQPSHSPNIAAKGIPQTQPVLQPQPIAQASSTYLRPANFTQLNPHQSQSNYQYAPQPVSQPQSSAQSISPSPLPATPVPADITFDHPLRSVTLKTLPLGRTLRLDSSEGVRTWVLRLSKGESIVDILDVRFEPLDSDDEDEDEEQSAGHVEDEVIVKANGTLIDAKVPNHREGEGVWEVADLKTGTNVLEVGEKEGEIWKIVLQRIELGK